MAENIETSGTESGDAATGATASTRTESGGPPSPAPRRKRGSKLPMLLGLFVALVGAAVVVTDPFGWRTPAEEVLDAADPGRRVLVDLAADEISAIDIDPPTGEAFRLEREGEDWFVEQGTTRHRADMERVEPLLADLAGLRAESLATSRPEEHAGMEVNDELAIAVSVYSGGAEPLSLLHVGKSAPGFSASFVRVNGDPEVYRAGANIKSQVAYAFNDFRNRKPWSFDPLNVTQLVITPPNDPLGGALELRREGELWQHAGGNANQNAITELLQRVTELDAGQFADDATPEQTQFPATPSLRVTTPVREYSLTLGAQDASYLYARDQDGVVYQLSDHTLDFYRELDFERLTFDDTPPEEAEADAAVDDDAEDDDATL